MITFHGSNEIINEIHAKGVFGGLFSATSEVALSHGCNVHAIRSPRPLTDFELNYQIDGAYEAAVEIAGEFADNILSPDCVCDDDGDFGFRLQQMRGQLAAKLGFTSVEMKDEHGTTWLCLTGCEVALVSYESESEIEAIAEAMFS